MNAYDLPCVFIQGTDFMERVISGVGWGPYMDRACKFWSDNRTRSICKVDQDTRSVSLDPSTLHNLLEYVTNYTSITASGAPAKKKQRKMIQIDKHFGDRALWNLVYWITAGQQPPKHTNGWVSDVDGRIVRREGAVESIMDIIQLPRA